MYDLRESSTVRVFYDHGRMEIMSPLPAHEKPIKVLHSLIIALRDALDEALNDFLLLGLAEGERKASQALRNRIK
jgi:hypothetical protein